MLKETGYQEKFEMLSDWLSEIIETVKRDLKNEHLKIDKEFCKKYFLGKTPQSLTSVEMSPAYLKDIQAGNIGLGEFIASRWLLKNTDIYGFFEKSLRRINPDFESIDLLEPEEGKTLMEKAIKDFGAKKSYIFSVFNSVVFDQSIYEKLKKLAIDESTQQRTEIQENEEKKTIAYLEKKHAKDLSSLQEKYERKFQGMEMKYLNDVQALKKQISALQKKLEPVVK